MLILTRDDILTSKGRYPDRAKSLECTEEVKQNCTILAENVTKLLEELGITYCDVSSGFRTSGANAGIANAAKRSLHMRGLAVDLLDDKDQTLAKLVESKPELLKKYNLWLENPEHTKGKNTNWVHLDMGSRTDRPSRRFNP